MLMPDAERDSPINTQATELWHWMQMLQIAFCVVSLWSSLFKGRCSAYTHIYTHVYISHVFTRTIKHIYTYIICSRAGAVRAHTSIVLLFM